MSNFKNLFYFSIHGLRLEYAVNANEEKSDVIVSSLIRQHPVEVCTCPEHFEGISCEACEKGEFDL